MSEFKKTVSGILSFLEKKSKTNLRKIGQQWSWLMLGKIVGALVALLLASAYANYLTPEQYGTYKYILSVFAIVAVFTLLGMEDASQRSIARGRDAAFWDTLKLRLAFGTLTLLSSLGIGVYYTMHQNYELGLIFILSAPFLIALSTTSHYNSLLMGRQLFKQISINNVIIKICSAVVIIIAVILTSNLYWLIAAFLFSGIVFSFFGFIHTNKKYPLNNIHDPEARSYGKHMSILSIISIATNQAAPFLLWHFLGPVQLAIYAFALAAVSQMRGVFKLLTTTMAFPKLAKLETHILKASLPKKVLIAHCISVPMAILLALIIPYLYYFLFPTYLESIIYAQVMTLLLAFSPMRLYSTALMAHGSPRSIHTYSIINSVSLLGGMVVLIPLFGIWGVIYANIMTQTITNSVVFYLFKKI